MRFKTFINQLEWMLFAITSYYIFLLSGSAIVSLFVNENTSTITKLIIAVGVFIFALGMGRLLMNYMAKYLYQYSSGMIILAYLVFMVCLSALLPFYINAVFTLFKVFPN